ncbi:TIGR00725 family protein [Salinigranum rubrum]|uniref:TIGR00725 family protein n=1 Tax=Salinigranum rubrum TaxID=755307 RepID=A0A2I8VPT6_9EURY|nr:TIGR00725 family protein [Salinigranum rubrum]AUV83950.1 TIGR00725 family protein [Salinigranum rubrum]
MRVSVVGGSDVDAATEEVARALGRRLAGRGHTVVCGGLGGVMRAVCEGAVSADGHTLGILPGERVEEANDFVETAVATGMGHARNALVVMNGDAVVAVAGSGGTLSEIGFAFVFGRPVAGLGTHAVDGVHACETPAEAVDYVEQASSGREGRGGREP